MDGHPGTRASATWPPSSCCWFRSSFQAISTDGGIQIAIAADAVQLRDFWSGQWSSEWAYDQAAGTLTGSVTIRTHYFEGGNVQMHASQPKVITVQDEAVRGTHVDPILVLKCCRES